MLENNVAIEEASNSAESATVENEVKQNVSEDANTPVKNYEEKYKQSIVALRREREEKRVSKNEVKELRERIAKLESNKGNEGFADDEVNEDVDNTSRYRQEALSQVTQKLAKDPTFRDRIDLVEEKMAATGMTLEQADDAVLADITRKMLYSSEPKKIIQPITTGAIPENTTPKLTGNRMEDILAGKYSNIPKGQIEAMRRVLGR